MMRSVVATSLRLGNALQPKIRPFATSAVIANKKLDGKIAVVTASTDG